MTKEQKIKLHSAMCNDNEHQCNRLNNYIHTDEYLTAEVVKVVEEIVDEATKEQQERCCEQPYEGSPLQAFDKLRKENYKLQEENKQAKEIIKSFYRLMFYREGFMELNDYNVWKAKIEAFLESQTEEE